MWRHETIFELFLLVFFFIPLNEGEMLAVREQLISGCFEIAETLKLKTSCKYFKVKSL